MAAYDHLNEELTDILLWLAYCCTAVERMPQEQKAQEVLGSTTARNWTFDLSISR